MQRLLIARAIQAKLAISQPGDAYEQEADRVADTVMGATEPNRRAPIGKFASAIIQRCSGGCPSGGCAHRDDEEPTFVQRAISQAPAGGSASEAQIAQPRGGQPLPAATRTFFEARMGQDFSGVRIHVDANAAQSARSINALAYTYGQNVVFSDGQYLPNTRAGQQLLAHELTHVVQQRRRPSGANRTIFRHAADKDTCLKEGWQPISARPKEIWLGANIRIENHYKATHENHAILTGSDFEYAGKPGSTAIQLPKGAPNKKSGDRLLNKFLGISRQLAPDIMDFTDRTFYEIKTLSGAGQGAQQLLGYYRLANEIATQEGDPLWKIKSVTWYPNHVLAFPGDTTKKVCTEATDYKLSGTPGLLIYQVFQKTEKKKEPEEKKETAAPSDQAQKIAEALAKLAAFKDELARELSNIRGDHQAQWDLIYKPSVIGFFGYWTNELFNTQPPLLMIWNDVGSLLTGADNALKAKNLKKALGYLIRARRAYLKAYRQYIKWKSGIPGAGAKMQIAIGVTAVAAIAAFVAPTLLAEEAAGASTGATATEQTLVRIADVITKADQAMLAADAAVTETEIMAQAELEAEMELFKLLTF